MMDGEMPEEYEAGAAALLPAAVKAEEISTPRAKLLLVPATPSQRGRSLKGRGDAVIN